MCSVSGGKRELNTFFACGLALETPRTILVADDHASLAGLEELLSAEGFNVLTARDGQVALAQFRQAQPDLVLPPKQLRPRWRLLRLPPRATSTQYLARLVAALRLHGLNTLSVGSCTHDLAVRQNRLQFSGDKSWQPTLPRLKHS